MKKATKQAGDLVVQALKLEQANIAFYLFVMKASELWKVTQINQRSEDEAEGYQRVLSPGRVRSVARYIRGGGIVPGAIIVSFDKATFDKASGSLRIPRRRKDGWIIDGQHRLAGAFEASKEGSDIQVSVVAFLKLSLEKQIELFITINKEAKNVPSSLYIDLLKDLPRQKSEKDLLDERVADIARGLNADESSPFYQRIIFTRTARAGEISLTNFARVLRPNLAKQSGVLGIYTQIEQEGAINNYYKALSISYPRMFKKEPVVFFRTVGFGAVAGISPCVQHSEFEL